MVEPIYFDNSATTPVIKEVSDRILEVMSNNYGNPSSLYKMGIESKKIVNDSKEIIAENIGCKSSEIYFTGSGSEGNNLAIKGVAFAKDNKKKHIITSKIEHHSVLNCMKYLETCGFSVSYINVDEDGIINLKELAEAITEDTFLISVMYINNEVGSIQPIREIVEIAHENGILFHCDAVQALGKINLNIEYLGVDMMTISAHKIFAPKGIGALYIRNGVCLQPQILGGGQENKIRAGTENVPYIAGFAKAIQMIPDESTYIIELQNYLIEKIMELIPDAHLNQNIWKSISNISNFSFDGVYGESLMLLLDSQNIYVSTGSACSSGSTEPSHVLMAMGKTKEQADGSIRISLSEYNSRSEILHFVKILSVLVERLRNYD